MKPSSYTLGYHEDDFIERMHKPKRPWITDMSAFEAIELRIDIANGMRAKVLEPYTINGRQEYSD